MWTDVKEIDSVEGTVTKFVFTRNDAVAETVLYRYPDYRTRTVICCSTMSGCPVGCRFCGAGNHFVKNLTGIDIVSQVTHAIRIATERDNIRDCQDIEKLQIMFMSMGEPMLNQKGMTDAIKHLAQVYPQAALLVSTIAPNVDYDWFFDLSVEYPQIGLQFSVHESTDEARNKLIPFVKKLNLKEISSIGMQWHNETGRKPFINYCAHDNNTSNKNVARLLFTFPPEYFNYTVSVICESNDGMPSRNDHQIELARQFSEKLVSSGANVRVFDPAGQDDIGGGCGQLFHVQKWMANNPDKAKPSCGHGRPRVGAPRPRSPYADHDELGDGVGKIIF